MDESNKDNPEFDEIIGRFVDRAEFLAKLTATHLSFNAATIGIASLMPDTRMQLTVLNTGFALNVLYGMVTIAEIWGGDGQLVWYETVNNLLPEVKGITLKPNTNQEI